MNSIYGFTVAGFCFTVALPQNLDMPELLPSFLPFEDKVQSGRPLFRMSVGKVECVCGNGLLEKNYDDVGDYLLYSVPDGYLVEISHVRGGVRHRMHVGNDFSSPVADICWDDPYAGSVLSSMVRIVFSQAILSRNAFSIHASAVVRGGHAFLFTGKSGTGKSTHSALWLKNIPGCRLLNDDSPVVRIEKGMAVAYGAPWSGKTRCYVNEGYPVQSVVRLYQATENRFEVKKDTAAFSVLLPGCAVIRSDRRLFGHLCDILLQLSVQVVVGVLECLPDREAAVLCYKEIMDNSKKK